MKFNATIASLLLALVWLLTIPAAAQHSHSKQPPNNSPAASGTVPSPDVMAQHQQQMPQHTPSTTPNGTPNPCQGETCQGTGQTPSGPMHGQGVGQTGGPVTGQTPGTIGGKATGQMPHGGMHGSQGIGPMQHGGMRGGAGRMSGMGRGGGH